MLNVLEFRAALARKGLTQKEVAKYLGISERTMCDRIKKKRFGTVEIEKLIPLLQIDDPMHIFFDNLATFKDTENPTGSIADTTTQ